MINTNRLTLRPLEVSDKHALAELFADAQVMEFSDNGPQDTDWTSRWVDSAIQTSKQSGHEVMVVIEKASDKPLGYCGLFDYDDIDGQPEVEIGYRLISSSWGKGYATEAAKALLAHAHSTLRLKRIVAMIDPGNVASRKVAEKIGMVCEKDIMMPGYTHPDQLYVSEAT